MTNNFLAKPFSESESPQEDQKETLYQKILQNKELEQDFFQESSDEDDGQQAENSNEDDDVTCSTNEFGRSFRFNKDHCLHVFNALKNGGNNNFLANPQNGGNSSYVNLNGQNRAEYQRHLELIDLRLDGFFKRKDQSKSMKK